MKILKLLPCHLPPLHRGVAPSAPSLPGDLFPETFACLREFFRLLFVCFGGKSGATLEHKSLGLPFDFERCCSMREQLFLHKEAKL